MNITKLTDYINSCKQELDKSGWLSEADETSLGVHTIGYIAKMFCINCYINDISVEECVEKLTKKIPGGKK